METSEFKTPMSPWPDLAEYAHSATLASRQLYYYDNEKSGESLPCVLVHGLGDEADTWRRVYPALAAHRRVIAPDLPGFGRSSLPAQGISIQNHIRALLELQEYLAVPKALWIGHSMGAILVQTLALEYPMVAAGLILLSGSLLTGKTRLNPSLILFLIPGLGELAYTFLRRNPQAAYRTLYPYYANLDGLPQVEREWLYLRVNQRVWSNKQRRAFLGSLRSMAGWLPAQQHNLVERLNCSHVPTLILWGEEDQIAIPQNGLHLAGMLPAHTNLGFQMIAHAGHNLQQDQPQAVLTSIERMASHYISAG